MGLDIGLSKAGLHVVIGQDFEPACVETMKCKWSQGVRWRY